MEPPAGSRTDLERAHEYLRGSPFAARVERVERLAGDASDRRYLRVTLSHGDSVVLAVHAGPIQVGSLPFVNVARLFAELPVAVPAILGYSEAAGVLALEDVGDITLQSWLSSASDAGRLARYREAASIVEVIQRRGAEVDPSGYLPYQLAFDIEKLTAELDFFVRHFIEAHRGIVLSPPEREALAGEWAAIAGELASEPRVLCHRDFHSRNLMVHGDRLWVLDFQDARLGPDTYDLVSLLRDSYVDPGDDVREAVIAEFMTLRGHTDAREFRRRFDLMSVQRNLKALGTFGLQVTVRGRVSYLGDVPRTLGYLHTTLRAHSRFASLLRLLASRLEELD
jgi:aminoglycoside/choline kinase family phosphotransferase